MTTSNHLLEVRNVETHYGKIIALRGVDLTVDRGEIVSLIGANGAGKSTLMMTICGTPQASSGQVIYDGEDITRMPTHQIMRKSIAQSPEGRRIFPRMSVMENLIMGAEMAGNMIWKPDFSAPSTCFRASRSAGTSAAVRFRAVSSRCWRSPGP